MTDEQIKDIVIALIETDKVHTGTNNTETGLLIADLINSIRSNTQ